MFEKEELNLLVVFRKEECCCSIGKFFQTVAKKLGVDMDDEDEDYDCTKISVTQPVIDEIISYYTKHLSMTEEGAEALLHSFGPQANLTDSALYHYRAEVAEGFIR